MPDKQKSAQKSRTSKTSSGSRRGAKPIQLTELQKILICNGGMGHRTLRLGKPRSGDGFSSRKRLSSKARRDMEAA